MTRPDRRPPTVPSHPAGTTETRADVARRRLAQLAESFETAETSARTPPAVAASHPGRHRAATTASPVRRGLVSGFSPRLASAHVRAVAGVSVCIAIVLVWWLLAQRPETADVDSSVRLSGETGRSAAGSASPDASPTVATGTDPTELVIDVGGKVRRPGLATLPPGSRVADAIKAAGGLRGRVDTSGLNLARPVVDGEQILVGAASADEPATGAAGGADAGAGAKVNLNSATIEELDELPGVGPVTAQAILDWRTENGRFSSVEDLLDVTGIGDKTFADLRDRVTV